MPSNPTTNQSILKAIIRECEKEHIGLDDNIPDFILEKLKITKEQLAQMLDDINSAQPTN